jgi:hypothetical protein
MACSFHKPKLLHFPCSHVFVTCAELGVLPVPFVSEYFKKESIALVCAQEVHEIAMFRLFTQNNEQVFYIPDTATKRGSPRRQPTHRISNMPEVAKIEKHHRECDNYGRTYKKCPMNKQPTIAEAGHSGNPHDRRPPQIQVVMLICVIANF